MDIIFVINWHKTLSGVTYANVYTKVSQVIFNKRLDIIQWEC